LDKLVWFDMETCVTWLEGMMMQNDTVLEALKRVIDPELGLNILIYNVQVDGGAVNVTMTLTTPGCPLHTAIARGAETVVRNLPGVEQATVNVVWEPPWTPERMSPEARSHLRWG
jgi:metal-sulfur cluster biosynthetic enzyme